MNCLLKPAAVRLSLCPTCVRTCKLIRHFLVFQQPISDGCCWLHGAWFDKILKRRRKVWQYRTPLSTISREIYNARRAALYEEGGREAQKIIAKSKVTKQTQTSDFTNHCGNRRFLLFLWCKTTNESKQFERSIHGLKLGQADAAAGPAETFCGCDHLTTNECMQLSVAL